jgi:erythromycin esterase-like protein
MGDVVWQRLGTDAYTIGFTAGGGRAGAWSAEPRDLDPPMDGSLEDIFMRAGFDDAFLDFRSPPPGGEWLRTSLWSRPLGNGYMRAVWPNHLDAMIFIRTMAPSTPATAAGAAGDGSA